MQQLWAKRSFSYRAHHFSRAARGVFCWQQNMVQHVTTSVVEEGLPVCPMLTAAHTAHVDATLAGGLIRASPRNKPFPCLPFLPAKVTAPCYPLVAYVPFTRFPVLHWQLPLQGCSITVVVWKAKQKALWSSRMMLRWMPCQENSWEYYLEVAHPGTVISKHAPLLLSALQTSASNWTSGETHDSGFSGSTPTARWGRNGTASLVDVQQPRGIRHPQHRQHQGQPGSAPPNVARPCWAPKRAQPISLHLSQRCHLHACGAGSLGKVRWRGRLIHHCSS